jgi:hypothetical protein
VVPFYQLKIELLNCTFVYWKNPNKQLHFLFGIGKFNNFMCWKQKKIKIFQAIEYLVTEDGKIVSLS